MKSFKPPAVIIPFLKENVLLRDFSTIKIGGTALYYAAPATLSELKDILGFSFDRNLHFISWQWV